MKLKYKIGCAVAAFLGATQVWADSDSTPAALAGTWELVAGFVIEGEKEVRYDIEGIKSRKILNQSDYAFVSRKNDEFWAASTGRYQTKDDQYTEIPDLLSYPLAPGSVYTFTFQVSGDDWHTQRYENGQLVEREHWRRLR